MHAFPGQQILPDLHVLAARLTCLLTCLRDGRSACGAARVRPSSRRPGAARALVPLFLLFVFLFPARALSASVSVSVSVPISVYVPVSVPVSLCVCLSLPLVSVSLPSLSNSALPSQHTVRPQYTVAWQPTALSQFVGRRALSSAAHKKPTEAGSEGGKAAPLFPMHKKGDNLFDLLGLCDYYGVGYKAARNWWAARYPDSYWIITKVKMTNTRPRTRRHVCVTCLSFSQPFRR